MIINTIQCGAMAETTPIWQEIAKLSEGRYAAIAQSGNMAVVATPMDTRLAELNRKIGETLIPCGDKDAQGAVAAKQAASESAPASATADRLSYNARTNKAVQGGGELLDALANGRLTLKAVDQKQLPAEFQGLSSEELGKRVVKVRADREEVQKEIGVLTAKRAAFLEAESKRLAVEGKGDAFDGKVTEAIHEQAAKKGINYAR
ncbi:MAG: hypothetical protein ACR2NX_10180 [Chthoniobacterales bacterium]